MARTVRRITRKVAGATRRLPRGLQVLLVLGLAVAVGTVWLRAVHDTGLFQLDGDARTGDHTVQYPGVTDGADDWDKVCYQVAINNGASASQATAKCSATSGPAASATGVMWMEELNSSTSIFTGGGSKDPQDISNWAWKDAGGLPDKDDLRHAYAVRYSVPAGTTGCPSGTASSCDVLYFGSDRYDNSGDAQQGFWFLQNEVKQGTNSVGGGTGFVGVHAVGDILAISDFSNGGTVSTITVYKWDPPRFDPDLGINVGCVATNKAVDPTNPSKTKADTGCKDANLRQLLDLPNAHCSASGPNDQACGLVNPATVTLPWSFLDKSGTLANQALNGELYEAAINLSTLGLAGECFASVVAETRSSTSTTSVLKDFVVGGFGQCGSVLKTTPKLVTAPDTLADIPAAGTSITTAGSIHVADSALLTISGASTFSGTLKFFLCGPGTAGFVPADGCKAAVGATPGQGVQIGTTTTLTNETSPKTIVSDAAEITSAGSYCWRAEFTATSPAGVPPAQDASQGECFLVNPVRPTLGTEASAGVVLGNPIYDTANLNLTANKPGSPVIKPTTAGGPADGTITFKLYGPFTSAPGANDCVAGKLVTTGLEPVTVTHGDGAYLSGNFIPTAPGTYVWVASYSGDLPNTLGTSDSACNITGEQVVVSDTVSATSAQKWLPNDAVVITSQSGQGLYGTLSITLHSGSCTGTLLYTEPQNQTLTNATSGATISTTNTGTFITGATNASFWWRMVFTPTDTNVPPVTKCETTSMTIDNNPQ